MKRDDTLVVKEFLSNFEMLQEQQKVVQDLRYQIKHRIDNDLEPKKTYRLKERLKVEEHRYRELQQQYDNGPKPKARKRHS